MIGMRRRLVDIYQQQHEVIPKASPAAVTINVRRRNMVGTLGKILGLAIQKMVEARDDRPRRHVVATGRIDGSGDGEHFLNNPPWIRKLLMFNVW